jgi:hypothetical protein
VCREVPVYDARLLSEGTRPTRVPDCRDKMMWAALFLLLAVVLLSSLAVGFGELTGAHRRSSAIAIPPPAAGAKSVELMG